MTDLQLKFKNENGYDPYSYLENENGDPIIIGFCENYVQWLENKINVSNKNKNFYNPKDTIKEQLITIISKRCEKAPYVDVANAVDDILKLPFEEISEIMIKWMAQNQHPHTMAEIDSTRAILWEGKQSHINDGFIVD